MGQVSITMDIDRDALVGSFISESEEALCEMEQALLSLDSQADTSDSVGLIFRLSHTLKGNATLLDLPPVAELAHGVEDLLDRIRDHEADVSSEIVTMLLQAVDVLRIVIADALGGCSELRPEAVELLHRLNGATVKPEQGPDLAMPHEATTASNASNRAATSKTLRVDLEKLDRMVNVAGEIAIARGRLSNALEHVTDAREVQEIHRSADALHTELHDLVMRLRMVRVGPTFVQFKRNVHDLAKASGKLVRLQVEDGGVELDTRVIELIRDPLMHMIRNSVDHGIESADERRSRGKHPVGTITLRALHAGGNVVIQVMDDGAGFNRQEILKGAQSRRLVGEAQAPSDEELLRFVFHPGFSTAAKVTELSGRGVGMDVVRRNIDALRGSVALESEEGHGSTVTIRIPLTLAVIEGFSVRVGKDTFVVPLDAVRECTDLPRNQHECSLGGVIELRGEALPYMRIRSVLGLEAEDVSREQILVIEYENTKIGLAVDALLGETQAVIKPLGNSIQAVPGISGSTILGDGRVALILDVAHLVREAIDRHGVWASVSQQHLDADDERSAAADQN